MLTNTPRICQSRRITARLREARAEPEECEPQLQVRCAFPTQTGMLRLMLMLLPPLLRPVPRRAVAHHPPPPNHHPTHQGHFGACGRNTTNAAAR